MDYFFKFNSRKNILLSQTRGICFEDVITLLKENKALSVIKHPNQAKYPGQNVYIINIDNYCYLVPFIRNGDEIFLKTIIPSRKATKKYLTETKEDKNGA